MKAIYLHAAGAITLSFTLAACIPGSTPPPNSSPASPPPAQDAGVAATPTPTQPPAQTPEPLPPPVVVEKTYDNYLDAPQTPGTWTYVEEPGESLALFGADPDAPLLIVRCGAGSGRIGIGRVIDGSTATMRPMQIQTETTTRILQANPVQSQMTLMVAELPAGDPLLDAMAITKGRFALGLEGENTLYLPAWVELTRVIEDCR